MEVWRALLPGYAPAYRRLFNPVARDGFPPDWSRADLALIPKAGKAGGEADALGDWTVQGHM